MNLIVQKKIYFNRLIRGFYKSTSGQTNYRVDLRQLGVELKITGDNFTDSYNGLKSEDFIEPFGAGYNSRLTDKGVNYVDSLEFLEDKEIVLCATKYLKTMTGYRKIYDIFDGIGVREDAVYRKELLDFMYKQALIEPSNYSDEAATISVKGRNLTEATYGDLHSKPIAAITNNSIVNHGPNYGNQSAGVFEGSQISKAKLVSEEKEKKKSLVSKLWELISVNPLISTVLGAIIIAIFKLLYSYYKLK